MAAGNRSPLGFGVIILFYLCLLAAGVLAQVIYEGYGTGALVGVLAAGIGVLVAVGIVTPRFYWDVFRTLKSAVVLITLLVLSSVLGTMLIQDLDLRRADVFRSPAEMGDKRPEFSDQLQSGRFALAETHALLKTWPNAERSKMLAEKVKLSPVEEEQVALFRKAFGDNAAMSRREAILASKERNVEQLTTSNYAKKNWATLYAFWQLCRRIHLFDIFEAWWFFLLLGLIAVTVIVGTIARAPWTVRDFGVAVTHAGIVIILAGALTDLLVAREGYMYLTYGRPEAQVATKISDQKNQLYHHLPFQVYLDRFATEYFHEMGVERVDYSRSADGKPVSSDAPPRMRPFSVGQLVPVREGVPRVFEDGQITVTVTDYKPRVIVKTVVKETPGGDLNPAVRLGLYNREGGGANFFVHGSAEPWFFAFDSRRSGLSMENCRFEYVWTEDQASYQRLLKQRPVPDNGTLIARSGGEVVRLPVRIGSETNLEIAGRSIPIRFVKIQSALADQENVNLDRRLQKSEEPVLYLSIDQHLLPVPRDDSLFSSNFEILDGVEFRFDWPNPKDAGVTAIFRVVDGEAGPVLVQVDDAGETLATRLQTGARPVALVRLPGGYLGLEGRVLSAQEGRGVEEITDEDFLGDVGGEEVDLSEILRGYLRNKRADGNGVDGARLEEFCHQLMHDPRLRIPPHMLAAWRAMLDIVKQDAEGGARLQADWEQHLRHERPDLVSAWERFYNGGDMGVDDRLLAAWARVEVKGPWGTVTREITPYDPPIEYGPDPDRPLYYFDLRQTGQARDWFSVLSVIDKEGWKVATHPAQVNSPLRYAGYRFFQATAGQDGQGLGVSGISVTMNPGVEFMYVGYAVLTLGVCYIFFGRPIIDRRRREKRRQEAAS